MKRNNANEGQSTSTEGKSIQGMKGLCWIANPIYYSVRVFLRTYRVFDFTTLQQTIANCIIISYTTLHCIALHCMHYTTLNEQQKCTQLQCSVLELQKSYNIVRIGAGTNNPGNCDNWVHNPRNGPDLSPYNADSTCTSTNRPLQPEQGGEQCAMATGYYQGNNGEEIDPLSQQPMFTSPSDLGRKWHYLHRRCYQPQRSRNFSFTVVSYNVLADGLLHSNSHLYNATEQWLKHWDYRRRNLLKELLHYNADVSINCEYYCCGSILPMIQFGIIP